MNNPVNERLLNSLSGMSRSQTLAFGLLILERLFPYLLSFMAVEKLDASVYQRAKELLWNALLNTPDRNALRSLHEECLEHVPDTEDYSHGSVSDALNAALITSNLLGFLDRGHVEHIVSSVQLVDDSVYLYVNALEDNGSMSREEKKQRIGVNPLVRAEVRRQKEDMEFVSRLPPTFTINEVALLKKRAEEAPPLLPIEAMRSADTLPRH